MKKVVVITGASRGIGKALAHKFLESGYEVLGTSTSGDADFKHDHLMFFPLDLSDSESISNCVAKIQIHRKKIDILVNNAGVAIEEEFENKTIVTKYLRKIIDVNVIGTVDFTEKIIPIIKNGGQIINISSRAGSLGANEYNLNYPSYRISKTALNMVTKVLALRLEGKIKVSAIHPGWVRTDMGGEEGELSPEEAAGNIYTFAHTESETGKFWFKQEEYPW